MNKLLSSRPMSVDFGTFLLRLFLGGMFVKHGYDALIHYDQYLAMSQSVIGLPKTIEFNLVVFSQLIFGLFIAVGFITRLSVIPIFICMAVALLTVHKHDPFFKLELALCYLLLCLPVFVLGSGRYSVDRAVFRK